MFESTIRKEGEPIGCFMVNSGVELGVLDPEISSLVNASYIRTEEFLTTLIEAGQQTGEIKRDLSPVATGSGFVSIFFNFSRYKIVELFNLS
ncbi:TetR family transcriptional regulator C-terminal domain-containing protein [Paenibacillus hubeiensis]|uniref:TetR family transcriptional regulator C-terminal domain-containing protein n=1 Tax=Paenibacillus hubeiensis TaxID=3077330 RepID=UPI0031BAC5DC